MSESEDTSIKEAPYYAERSKNDRAACRKCKDKCDKGELRIAKLVDNAFGGSGKMKQWYHLNCLFEMFMKQRATTKRINAVEDVGNWEALSEQDRTTILDKADECEKGFADRAGQSYVPIDRLGGGSSKSPKKSSNNDNSFEKFQKLCKKIAKESSYLEKTARVREQFQKRSESEFQGDLKLWCRFLLPMTHNRVYNLQSKQLIKQYARIFKCPVDAMLEHLEQGDISDTIQHFFKQSTDIKPATTSTLTLNEIENFLERQSMCTREDDQMDCLKSITKRCTATDLRTIIRLIKKDLRINAGPKHILEALHADAYAAFQSSHDLDGVVERFGSDAKSPGSGKKKPATAPKIALMTPVLPMLAEPCKSVEQAMAKCPNGMYAEIKYDGERVQLHKKGSDFRYFSRSLKPVVEHKVSHFKEYIPKAFPHANDLILDAEVLLIDNTTGKPLPFGSLGVHKQQEFTDANVCLFVFDCLYYNGEDLTVKPIKERKRILRRNMTEIGNHVMFSELRELTEPNDLARMIVYTLEEGLEGLVLKDRKSVYEPGKRHWLKVKKDYLFDGSMADTADLVVLGAWFGTGKKGGMMSVFLMGCYDPRTKRWCTVTKVHTGHDDETLERLQTELDMVKIQGDANKVPKWLNVTKTLIPDFVARDPERQPVWEITGAEFTRQHNVHTADGISVRFPRVTKIRSDKTWETATSLPELQQLFRTSKESLDGVLVSKLKEHFDAKRPIDFKRKIKLDLDENHVNEPSKKRKSDQKPAKNLSNPAVPERIYEPKRPLPDMFLNVKLYVESMGDKSVLRHFIAYGGRVLEARERFQATHVVHKHTCVDVDLESFAPGSRHVTEMWLRDCVRAKAVLNTLKYAVRLRV